MIEILGIVISIQLAMLTSAMYQCANRIVDAIKIRGEE